MPQNRTVSFSFACSVDWLRVVKPKIVKCCFEAVYHYTVFPFQTWNRVVVQDVDMLQKKAQVLYIDYGNEEVIPVNRIHQLNRNIDLFPPCVSLFYFLKIPNSVPKELFLMDTIFACLFCHGSSLKVPIVYLLLHKHLLAFLAPFY